MSTERAQDGELWNEQASSRLGVLTSLPFIPQVSPSRGRELALSVLLLLVLLLGWGLHLLQ